MSGSEILPLSAHIMGMEDGELHLGGDAVISLTTYMTAVSDGDSGVLRLGSGARGR